MIKHYMLVNGVDLMNVCGLVLQNLIVAFL